MSRKCILSLATAAAIITVGLASSGADARGFGGGGGHFGGGVGQFAGGGHFAGTHFSGRSWVFRGPRGPRGGYPGYWAGNHHRWWFRDGVWVDVGGVDEAIGETPALAAPGPCTCLTKTYTPAGLVVFADICTQESASAPVGGKAADATQAPTTPN